MRLLLLVDCVGLPLSRGVCLCLCVCFPAAQSRVIQMCVSELYALDKSTLSPVLGLYDSIPTSWHTLFLFVLFFLGALCDI